MSGERTVSGSDYPTLRAAACRATLGKLGHSAAASAPISATTA